MYKNKKKNEKNLMLKITMFLIQFLLNKQAIVSPLMSDFLKETVLDLLDHDVLVHV